MIEYRRLAEGELEALVELRVRQLRDEGAEETFDLRPALRDYYARHLADDSFVCWVAAEDGEIIATGGMAFVEKPPYYGCPSGRVGLLANMYTDPRFRRRGIARQLLSRVVEEARNRGCGVVQITASKMGQWLYADFGFERNERFMQYRLQQEEEP